MCSVSKLSKLLPSGGASGPAQEVAASEVRKDRASYVLVDVRELDESGDDSDLQVDHRIPLGSLLRDAMDGKHDEWKAGKTVVMVCNVGYRAGMAATALQGLGIPAKVMQHGVLGWSNAAASKPEFVVVLGLKHSSEKITLALSMCSAAAADGQRVVLVLMGDGVCTFLKDASKEAPSEASLRVNDVVQGPPFKPCADLLKSFLGSGRGAIIACTTCMKHRGFEVSDLLPCAELMQLPDFLRMLKGAQSNVQFL